MYQGLTFISNYVLSPSQKMSATQAKSHMGVQEEFEDIRPYRDHEVAAVVERLIKNPSFYDVIRYVHPGLSDDAIREKMDGIDSIADFQKRIAHPAMRILVNRTTESLSVSGMENVKKDQAHLFISNHRDIILDSANLNVLLYENGFGTTETAIGNNLLSSDLITDLTKLNKNFVVIRNTGAREFYENSMRLSAYIRHTITQRKANIWIAQREGRTKDGMDKTQPGLLKMLSINCDDPLRFCFRSLRITPVAISYENDPCDVFKIPELKAISREEKYEKAPGEDFRSIITGLTGAKGRVHVSIGKTIDEELEVLADFPNMNDKLRIFGELIDQQIFQNYRLWPTNYMAFDLLENQIGDKPEYEGHDIRAFDQLLRDKLQEAGLSSDEDYRFLLGMYANPVKNYLSVAK